MDITIGSAVYSRAGRDKGEMYLVVKLEDGYAYLSDGLKRKLANPKKKKLKHLNKTNYVSDIFDGDEPEDFMIRKALAEIKPI